MPIRRRAVRCINCGLAFDEHQHAWEYLRGIDLPGGIHVEIGETVAQCPGCDALEMIEERMSKHPKQEQLSGTS